jgi:hypothetical protein
VHAWRTPGGCLIAALWVPYISLICLLPDSYPPLISPGLLLIRAILMPYRFLISFLVGNRQLHQTHTPFIPYVKNNRIKLLISLQTIDFCHCQLAAFSYL